MSLCNLPHNFRISLSSSRGHKSRRQRNESAVAVARGRIVAASASGDNADTQPGDDVRQLMNEAKDALRDGELERSVALYTRALQMTGAGHRREAREYLGLARERNGQVAHARAEYEAFLAEFPEGTDAERVRQRLAGMLSAAQSLALNNAARRGAAVAQAAHTMGAVALGFSWRGVAVLQIRCGRALNGRHRILFAIGRDVIWRFLDPARR